MDDVQCGGIEESIEDVQKDTQSSCLLENRAVDCEGSSGKACCFVLRTVAKV